MQLHRKDGGTVGTMYVTADGQWEVWRETYPPKRWYVNSVDSDETSWADGFATKKQAVASLAKFLATIQTWDIWLYHAGAGWWLHEDGYDRLDDASSALKDQMAIESTKTDKQGRVIAGLVVASGKANDVLR